MSRIDENQDMLEKLKKIRFTGTDSAMITSVLIDISQSLAVMADCCLDEWQKNNTEVDDGK